MTLLTWLVLFAAASLFAAAAVAVERADREFSAAGRLSTATVRLVYAVYGGIVGLIVAAAQLSLLPLPIPGGVAAAVGAALVVAGLAVAGAGVLAFRSLAQLSGTAAGDLVTGGIYRYGRNPQNVGLLAALLGVAIAGRSGLGVAVVAGAALVIDRYVRHVEEPHLERTFGERYRRYRDRTPRYLGRPGDG